VEQVSGGRPGNGMTIVHFINILNILTMSKTEIDSPISPNFFKPFKNLDEFNSFFITFFKQGEEMLKVELEEHLG
jgi:hypothetical protein